jgi:DNA polymerase-3 subunit alpha
MAGVLLKKQVRVSAKTGNKFAFLQMSDATGVYEAMMFSEMLAMVKDKLNEGEAFLLKVMVEQREEQLRFTIHDIDLLDEKLAGRIRRVEIELDSDKPLSNLQEILKVEGSGPAKIVVMVPVRDGLTAEIELPGKWNFPASARNALLRLDGVKTVNEQ